VIGGPAAVLFVAVGENWLEERDHSLPRADHLSTYLGRRQTQGGIFAQGFLMRYHANLGVTLTQLLGHLVRRVNRGVVDYQDLKSLAQVGGLVQDLCDRALKS
jgi:hypothetical protein